jgi:chaperonin GroES
MDLALQVQKDKSFPWSGCSNVVFPLVTIAALQFSARSYSNIIHGSHVVNYRVPCEDPSGLLQERADRISRHMSWQVLEEDSAWEEQHDRLLLNLAIVGTNFIKTYYSPKLGHNVSELVMARDFVLDYYARSVNECSRKTQVIMLSRNEIYEKCMNDTFRDVRDAEWFNSTPKSEAVSAKQDNRQGVTIPEPDEDTPFRGLEQHRFLDLDHDGYAEPYIVTLEAGSKQVLRIVSRIEREEDIDRNVAKRIRLIVPTEYYTKYSFIPAPDGGIYDVGFGILLGPLNESVNTGINQLLDAGTMQNTTGGFLGRGAKIRGGVYTMAPWEWKRVDSTGDDLRKSLVPFPERQPSAVMFNLLQLLIQYTDRISGTTEQMVGENPGQNTPAETSRNTLEQGMQVYNMIFKRVWRSMKEEFKKLHKLNAIFLQSKHKFGQSGSFVLQEDYKSNPDQVVPLADPNVTSKAARVNMAITVKQSAMTTPGYNLQEVEKNLLHALQVDGIDRLYPGPDKVPPLPNPKMHIEEMKLQGKQMDLEARKAEWSNRLMEERRLNTARIHQLEAQAMSLAAEADATKAGIHIQAFETAMNMLKSHNDMLNERIEAMSGGNEGGKSKSGDGGGREVSKLAGGPGDAAVQGVSPPMAGAAQGPMG